MWFVLILSTFEIPNIETQSVYFDMVYFESVLLQQQWRLFPTFKYDRESEKEF